MKTNTHTKSLRLSALALAACSAFFAGCSDFGTPEKRAAVADVSMKYHNGHQYLVFEVPGKVGASIIHDPDCPKCAKH